MRKISIGQLLSFLVLATVAALAAYAALRFTWRLLEGWPELRGLVSTLVAVLMFYGWLIALHRAMLAVAPLREGDISEESSQEFVYHVYLLFYLIFFFPVMSSFILPVPAMRLFYQLLGARFGTNSFPGGVILDPRFVTVGDNTLLGRDSILIPHAIEGRHLAHFPIRIGSNVTIGARAILMAGVEVGDGAVIAVNSVVGKGQNIPAGEIWGGTPARKLGANEHLGRR